jgi:PAS domain S-box-containing protein
MPKFAPAARRMASTVMRYGLAMFCVVAALLVTELLQYFTDGPPWFVFLAAVMISSWAGGLGPGLLAVLLSTLAVDYFFVPPLHSLSLKTEYLPLVIFGLSALLISWLSDRRKRAETALRQARDELEARVQARTAELTRINEQLQAEIAERTRAEVALRESEEQWRAVFEHNPTMYFMVDAAGTILSVNPFGAEQLGYTVEELVGHPVLNVFYEAYREAVRRNVAACFAHLGRAMSWEFRKVRKDGPVIWVRETARAMLMRNHPIVLIVCEDITERKRAEEALKRTEQRLRAVIANAPIILVALDRAGVFTLSEGKGLDALGLEPGQVVGQSVFEVYRDAPQVLSAVRRALAGEPFTGVVDVNGLVFETHYIPVLDEGGQVAGVNGVAINITERKRAEEERQAHLWFLESMDRINRAIQGTNDLEQMMSDVLDALLTVFHCDRAWLVYPCDPEALWHGVKMQRTRPEFPGLFSVGLDVPVDPETADVLRTVRAASGPVRFGPGSPHPLPAKLAKRLGIQSRIVMALYPKSDQPYMFGLSQCSYPRVWTPQEERLFQEIGRRLEDALTTLLMFRNLQESEARLEEAQRIAHVGYWVRDLDTDRFTWSDETYRIFGLPPQERTINFAGLQELIHSEDRQIMVRAVAEALGGGARYDVEYRVVRPGGEVRIVHSQGNVMRDESGRPRRMFGTVQDITERRRAEEQLFEIKERFRLLAESSLTGIYLIQEDRFRYVNPAMAKIYGYRVEEIVDHLGPMDLVHPDDRPVVAENLRRRIEGEVEEVRYGFRGLRKDGSVCYVEVHGRRIEHGGKVGVLGTLLDITERRRAEEGLRESERRYRNIFEAAGVSIWEEDFSQVKAAIDELKGQGVRDFRQYLAAHLEFVRHAISLVKIIDVNDATVKLFGARSKDELLVSLHAIFTPETQDVFAGELVAIAEGQTSFESETVLQNLQGDKLTILFTMTFPPQPATLDSVLVSMMDITERKRAEYLTRQVFETSPDGVSIVGRDYRYQRVNLVYEQIWGMPAERIVGMHVADLLGIEVFEQTVKPYLDRCFAGEVVRYAEWFTNTLGRQYLALSYSPLQPDAARVEAALVITRDLTEHMLASEALRQAQAELAHVTRVLTLGEITASIAHEVNQPLAGVTTNGNAALRWLSRDPPNIEEARACLQRIIRDGNRASEVIARMRALVKKSAPTKARLDLRDTIHDVLAIIDPEARRHRVLARTDLAAGLPPVRGDRVQVQQVLLNLLLNGIDAMKAVTDRRRVLRIRAQPHEAGQVLVTVQDTGVGLDPQSLARLFEPFYTTKPEGMGLGLSISRSIIEAHGGRLWASANDEQGATFQFTLPADDGNQHD